MFGNKKIKELEKRIKLLEFKEENPARYKQGEKTTLRLRVDLMEENKPRYENFKVLILEVNIEYSEYYEYYYWSTKAYFFKTKSISII